MILYAESSAVLAWLLGESRGTRARDLLAGADVVFASQLTVAECERAITRLETSGVADRADAAVLSETLSRAASYWIRHEVDDAVLARVGRPFPVEPVRTLDAIHLATALELRAVEPRLTVLTFDERVRVNAERLGLGLTA